MAPDLVPTRLGDAHVPPAGFSRELWARLVDAGATEWVGYQCGPAIVYPEGHAAAVLRGVLAELSRMLTPDQAEGELVALVAPAAPPAVAGYSDDEVLRMVRAAIAFRRAAPRHAWPYMPWSEMSELCAAVDRKPGPDGQGARAPKLPVVPVLAGVLRDAADKSVHAAVAHPMAVYYAVCVGGELDERHIDYARRIAPRLRCEREGCAAAYALADEAEPVEVVQHAG